MKIVVFFGLLLSLISSKSVANTTSCHLKVVTTFSILSDLVKTVGGDDVSVDTIVPENADPHTYQPTPSDAKSLANADLVFVNGLGFEGWMERLIRASGYKGPIIVAAQHVVSRSLIDTKGNNAVDPHAWHSVQNGILYVKVITKALSDYLSHRQSDFQKRSEFLIHDLNNLDQWVKDQFQCIPSKKRLVVTTHDAFWYYGDAYNIRFLSPVGISTNAEPSAASIAQLIQQIRGQNIKAIFIENLSSRKLIAQISKEAQVTIGGTLYADSLSTKEGVAPTYIQMIRHNTQEIVKALKEMKN